MSAMYLPYVYLVTNKITNEFYYGSRCKNVKENRTPEEDFWIHYFTSSKEIKKQIKEYGKELFDIQIIMKDEDYDKCYWFEQQLIKENIKNLLCMNGTYVDPDTKTNKFSTAGSVRPLFSEEWRKKMSESHKGERNINYGKSLTTAALEKLSNSKLGKKQSAEHKKKNSDSNKGENNHMFGKSHTSKALQKIKDSANNRLTVTCPCCGKSGKISAMKRWHFDKCKYL
jgi:hypothetical protein